MIFTIAYLLLIFVGADHYREPLVLAVVTVVSGPLISVVMVDADLQTLTGYLQQTLSPDRSIGRAAETCLQSIEANPNYAILLLKLIDKKDVDTIIRVAAAVTFKNFVKRNWVCDGDVNKISEADRKAIKSTVIGLMLQSEEHIQRQLSDAISIIGREDFPAKWGSLLSTYLDEYTQMTFTDCLTFNPRRNGPVYTAQWW